MIQFEHFFQIPISNRFQRFETRDRETYSKNINFIILKKISHDAEL